MSEQLEEIFEGIPPSESRKALAEYVRKSACHKYVVPFSGRFAAAETIAKASPHWKPENMRTSDISLFSSAVGYWLSGQDLKGLNVQIQNPKIAGLATYFDGSLKHAAAILLALKHCQLVKRKPFYYQEAAKELLIHIDRYLAHVMGEFEQLGKTLKGINYRVADYRTEIVDCKNDADVLLYLNPPAYQSGYSKMFDVGESVTWNEPKIKEFNVNSFREMLEDLSEAPCNALALAIRFPSKENLSQVPKQWQVAFSQAYPNEIGKSLYLVTNKKLDIYTSQHVGQVKPRHIQIYGDEDVWKGTQVSIVPLNHAEATYYRDLWVHKLGTTGAEFSALMCLDGRAFTVFGLTMTKARQGDKDNRHYIFEMYGISCPSKRWLRLNRLFMRLLVSVDMKRWLLKQTPDLEIFDVEGVKTVCLSRFPEVRINNNLLKIEKKERLPNGVWKLQYYSQWHNKSWRHMILEWLDEEKKLSKIRTETPEET